MITRYKNSWYIKVKDSPEYFETHLTPITYKDYLIYERNDRGYSVFDIVRDDICIGQYNGINGAKQRVDEFVIANSH